jgi:predicted peptidase
MQLRDRLKQYKKSIWKAQDNDILNYRFRGPDNIKYNCKYPLLFFLHGAGGRGSNNEDQLLDAGSLGAFSKQNIFSKHSSYILAPQVPNDKKWVDVEWNTQKHDMPKISNTMDMALKLLDEIIDTHPIDINRIYILGLSMGGFGVWDALQRRPNFFAAGVPICGGGDTSKSRIISHIPIWAWHGDRDIVIHVDRSRNMYRTIKKYDANITYSEIKERGHDVWLDAWNSKELWDWIYQQHL